MQQARCLEIPRAVPDRQSSSEVGEGRNQQMPVRGVRCSCSAETYSRLGWAVVGSV